MINAIPFSSSVIGNILKLQIAMAWLLKNITVHPVVFSVKLTTRSVAEAISLMPSKAKSLKFPSISDSYHFVPYTKQLLDNVLYNCLRQI